MPNPITGKSTSLDSLVKNMSSLALVTTNAARANGRDNLHIFIWKGGEGRGRGKDRAGYDTFANKSDEKILLLDVFGTKTLYVLASQV